MNPHFTALEAAYQLRYYLCFKTKYLKPTLAATETQDLANQVLSEVCERTELSPARDKHQSRSPPSVDKPATAAYSLQNCPDVKRKFAVPVW